MALSGGLLLAGCDGGGGGGSDGLAPVGSGEPSSDSTASYPAAAQDGVGLVADLGPDPYPENPPVAIGPSLPVDGRLFLSLEDGGRHGSELWVSDGSAAGTKLVVDLNTVKDPLYGGTQGSRPASFNEVGGAVYFTADDGVHGRELWRTDGTGAGTTRFTDFPDGDDPYASSGPDLVVTLRDRLVFSAPDDDGGATSLWASDGTADGTLRIGEPGADPAELTVVGDHVLFTVDAGQPDRDDGRELWRTDGTAEGTVMVADLTPADIEGGLEPTDPGSLTAVGSRLYFLHDDGVHGRELWTSDGTPEGTSLVRDIDPAGSDIRIDDPDTDAIDLGPTFLTAWDDLLAFSASDDETGSELWTSDGTTDGTAPLDVVPGAGGVSPGLLTVVGDRLFFTGYSDDAGQELWSSDGTVDGTALVEDIDPGRDEFGPSGSHADWLTAAGDTLWFSADDGVHGPEPWRSDGTAAGTRLVEDVEPPDGLDAVGPETFVALGDVVLFTHEDGLHGRELWSNAEAAVSASRTPEPSTRAPSEDLDRRR